MADESSGVGELLVVEPPEQDVQRFDDYWGVADPGVGQF